MTTVLAVHKRGPQGLPVNDVAASLGVVMGAATREMSLTSGADPAVAANRILAELALPDTILVVLPGAATERHLAWLVLQQAQKPVVLAPSAHAGDRLVSRALLPLDGTPESAAAVAETMNLLAHAGVDLVVLHVFDVTTAPKFWDHPVHAEKAWQSEFLARFCAHPGARLHLRTGVPGERLLEVAASEKVDLIALGWSQHLDEGRARTVRQTVRDADVPVLIVPIRGGSSGPSPLP